MRYIYILQSLNNNRFYTGYTSDMNKRVSRHNGGGNLSTRSGRPWELVYFEKYPNKIDAMRRERQIKKYKGGSAFKKLIKHAWVAE